MSKVKVTVVGGGLAGSEAALVLSKNPNVEVSLYEMRPVLYAAKILPAFSLLLFQQRWESRGSRIEAISNA